MTKGPTLQGIWDDLPAERKARIEARTRVLEAEYLTAWLASTLNAQMLC